MPGEKRKKRRTVSPGCDDRNDEKKHDDSCKDRSGQKMGRFLICRRATYSYVLVGGAVAKKQATQDKSKARTTTKSASV
jgi:hypothetical protein